MTILTPQHKFLAVIFARIAKNAEIGTITTQPLTLPATVGDDVLETEKDLVDWLFDLYDPKTHQILLLPVEIEAPKPKAKTDTTGEWTMIFLFDDAEKVFTGTRKTSGRKGRKWFREDAGLSVKDFEKDTDEDARVITFYVEGESLSGDEAPDQKVLTELDKLIASKAAQTTDEEE